MRCFLRCPRCQALLGAILREVAETTSSSSFVSPLDVSTHSATLLLDRPGVATHPQESKTDQQMSFPTRRSSNTSSRIASGSCSRFGPSRTIFTATLVLS